MNHILAQIGLNGPSSKYFVMFKKIKIGDLSNDWQIEKKL